MSEQEELAEVLFQWNTPDDPYFVIQGRHDTGGDDPYLPIADAVLASPWLRAHDDRIRAEAWDEAVQALAWATDNGNDPLGYVARNNPYAAALRAAAGTPTHHTTEEDA